MIETQNHMPLKTYSCLLHVYLAGDSASCVRNSGRIITAARRVSDIVEQRNLGETAAFVDRISGRIHVVAVRL